MRAGASVDEDAWGSDADGNVAVDAQALKWWQAEATQNTAVPVTPTAPGEPATDAPPQASAQHSARRCGAESLHSICLGVLGEHLEELLRDPYCRHDVLPLLPASAKACLLAVARLRALLCDAALLALADEGQAVLDLAGAGAALSDVGIRQALRRMPHLRQVDLTSCPVGAATLRTLGECCPSLELLRLGSPVTDTSAGRALRDILPVLDQRQQAPAADSWDSLLLVDDCHALSAAVAGSGRLMQLQCLHWANIPYRLAEHCQAACPKVALNPSPEQAAAWRLPAAAGDPSMPLDLELLADVSNSGRWEQAPDAPQQAALVHIAERFRLAYVSREARLKAKMERHLQQQRRREQRSLSRADQLIEQWEGDF